MGEIVARKVAHGQLAEHIVQQRGCHFDGRIALHRACRIEAGEGEGVDIFLERHAVLQADRDGDGEVVHHAAEGRAFLMHVDENFPELAVVVFAGADIDLMAADDGFLGVALTAVGQALTFALHDAFDDALGHDFGA